MTDMSRERALLRRLVESDGDDFAAAFDAARALLAEPEKQRWQSDLTVDQHLLCDSNRAGKVTIDPTLLSPPTPHSRTEAEAMVTMAKAIDAAQNEDGVTENHAPKHFSNEAAFGWRIGYEDGQNSVQQHLDSVMETARALLAAYASFDAAHKGEG